MKFPFNTRQFLDVFKNYNHAIWPLQLIFILLAVITVCSIMWKPQIFGKFIPATLSFLWIWMGAIYNMVFFAAINEAANIFGLLFMLQGLIFLRYSIIKTRSFEIKKNVDGIAAITLIVYSLVIYPVIGYYMGHGYPYSPTFGLPCPTTIFTFGILITARQRLPFYLLVIPTAWAIIGFSAAIKLGMYEDIVLIISAIIFCALHSARYKDVLLFRNISTRNNLKFHSKN